MYDCVAMTIRIVLVLFLASASFAQQDEGRAIAITHVTLVDTSNGSSKPDMTVIVVGDRIRAIQAGGVSLSGNRAGGGRELGKGTEVVDGRGKFLLPGLFDMHVHLSWSPS